MAQHQMRGNVRKVQRVITNVDIAGYKRGWKHRGRTKDGKRRHKYEGFSFYRNEKRDTRL